MKKKIPSILFLFLTIFTFVLVYHKQAQAIDLPIPPGGEEAYEIGKKIGGTLGKIAKDGPVSFLTEEITKAALAPFTLLAILLKIFVGILFSWSAFVFGVVLNLNFNILQPTSATYAFITTGWGIVRDVANLGFVLFIILIALATIVRYQDYEAKRLLPRLIGAAILVNFSLTIPTVFINFSNILSNYFMSYKEVEICNQLPEKPEEIRKSCYLTVHMGSVLQPQKYFIEPSLSENELASLSGIVTSAESGMMKAVFATTGQYLGVMFLAIGVFVMTCYAILFLIRFIAFHFLLVLAPATWLFWVIPGTKHLFQKWWTKFTQYVFFAPAALFFLYLVIHTGKGMNSITGGFEPTPYLGFTQYNFDMFLSIIRTGVITFVMFGFLIGGLLVSQQLSIHGASGVVNFGKNAGRKAKQWAQRKTKEGGRAAVASRGGMLFAQQLTRNKLTAPIGNYLAKVGEKKKEQIEKERETGIKSMLAAGLTPEEIKRGIYKPGTIAALNRTIADTGKPLVEDIDDKEKSLKYKHDAYEETKQNEENKKDQYNKLKNDLEDSIYDLEAERDRTTDPIKKEELTEKLTAKRARLNQAENDWERAKTKTGDAKYEEDEAKKALNKAKVNFNEFEEHFLSGFSNIEKQMWKDAKFDLSKTPFTGSEQLKDRQVPDVSTKGLNDELKRLEKAVESAAQKLSNPNLSEGERLALKQLHDKASTDHEKLESASKDIEKARSKHGNAMNKIKKLKDNYGGYEKIPESESRLVWGEIQEAENEMKEAKKRISLLRTPIFAKKGGAKEKTEPKPKIKITSEKTTDEESNDEEE